MSKYIFIYRDVYGYYMTELIKNDLEFTINNVIEYSNLEFKKLLSLLKQSDNSIISSNIDYSLNSSKLLIDCYKSENIYYHYYKFDDKNFDKLLMKFLDKLNCNQINFTNTNILKFLGTKLNNKDCIKEHDSYICSLILAFESTEMFFSVEYIEQLKLEKAIEYGFNSVSEFEDRYKRKLEYSVITGVTILD